MGGPGPQLKRPLNACVPAEQPLARLQPSQPRAQALLCTGRKLCQLSVALPSSRSSCLQILLGAPSRYAAASVISLDTPK